MPCCKLLTFARAVHERTDGNVARVASVSVDDILEQIRQRGGRVSPVTRRIVEMVAEQPASHVRSAEFIQRVNDIEPTTESTVYRTLDRLVAYGILERLQLGIGGASFHLGSHNHEHLVCERCGDIIDVPADLLDGVANRVLDDQGFLLKIGFSSLYGTCAACQAVLGDPSAAAS